jgi:hypothetical protein
MEGGPVGGLEVSVERDSLKTLVTFRVSRFRFQP